MQVYACKLVAMETQTAQVVSKFREGNKAAALEATRFGQSLILRLFD